VCCEHRSYYSNVPCGMLSPSGCEGLSRESLSTGSTTLLASCVELHLGFWGVQMSEEEWLHMVVVCVLLAAAKQTGCV